MELVRQPSRVWIVRSNLAHAAHHRMRLASGRHQRRGVESEFEEGDRSPRDSLPAA
jgi:hypothetical protein